MAACVSGFIRLIGAHVCTLGASLTGLPALTIRELHDLVGPRLVETSVHWLRAHGTRLTQGVKPRVHSRLSSYTEDKSPCNKRAS